MTLSNRWPISCWLGLTQFVDTADIEKRIMQPSALLVTMKRYWGVANRLRTAAAGAPGRVNVRVETVHDFDEVPPLMRSDVDLIALDGHGWMDDGTAYFGTNDDLRVCPNTLRGEMGEGIVAPIVMFGFCWGARDPFRHAVEGAIDRSQVAFVGCTRKAKYNDAERLYPPMLSLLAWLGSAPDPVDAHSNIKLIEPTFGSAWRAGPLLQRRRP